MNIFIVVVNTIRYGLVLRHLHRDNLGIGRTMAQRVAVSQLSDKTKGEIYDEIVNSSSVLLRKTKWFDYLTLYYIATLYGASIICRNL